MKKPKDLGQLSIKVLEQHGGLTNMTPGNNLVHRFCDAVDAGKTPDIDDLKLVAHAIEQFRYGTADDKKLREFSSRLGTWRKQGKEASSATDWWAMASSVENYFEIREERLQAGLSEKEATVEARRKVAANLGIGDRAMSDRIKKYSEVAWSMYLVASYQPPQD